MHRILCLCETISNCCSFLPFSSFLTKFLPELSFSLFVQLITQWLFAILEVFPMIFHVTASIAADDCYIFLTHREGTAGTSVYIMISKARSFFIPRMI